MTEIVETTGKASKKTVQYEPVLVGIFRSNLPFPAAQAGSLIEMVFY